ncbi:MULTISPECIES: VOC family protein [Pirellulaceae]|nr:MULTISPECIES: VOC family protein [Pirellulaceae]
MPSGLRRFSGEATYVSPLYAKKFKEMTATPTTRLSPFHLAVQVHDLAAARDFYGGLLGCSEGRSTSTWVDFDFFGHQFVCHLNTNKSAHSIHYNEVDGHGVPVPHFGVVLDMESWETLATQLKEKGVEFVIAPYIRFAGEPGEQGTMFFFDPSGNPIEIKGFSDMSRLFAK